MTNPMSPTSPKRRRLVNGQSAPSTPASPAMRAISGLRSWLSPWRGNVHRSAAFGRGPMVNDEEEVEGDESHGQEQVTTPDFHADGQESLDDSTLLYPALPSSSTMPSLSLHKGTAFSRSIFPNDLSLSQESKAAASNGPSAYPFTFAAPESANAVANNPFNDNKDRDSLIVGGKHSPRATQFSSYTSPQATATGSRQHHSPLSRNYDLLAKFFSQKAAEEANEGGVQSSYGSTDGENRLTEDEVRGCLRLIEESGGSEGQVRQGFRSETRQLEGDAASESGFEVPRRRAMVRQSWLSPAPAYQSHSPGPASAPFRGIYSDRMSMSPDQPRHHQMDQRSNMSFLAPLEGASGGFARSTLTISATEPALFARSLIGQRSAGPSTGPSSTTSSASRSAFSRRRRPLYLGPGMTSTRTSRKSEILRSDLRRSQTASTIGLGKRQRTEVDSGADEVMQDSEAPANFPPPPSERLSEAPRFIASPGRMETSTGALSQGRSALQPASIPTRVDLHPTGSPASPPTRLATHRDGEASSPPSATKSRTASAVLSILAQPDLPKPSNSASNSTRSVRLTASTQPLRRSKRSQSRDPEDSSVGINGGGAFRPDTILNPYQTASNLQLASTRATISSGGKSRSAEAVEKMKDERRRSSRLRKGAAAAEGKESEGETLLEKIERSKPASLTAGHRRRGGNVSPFASHVPATNGNGSMQPVMEESPDPTPSQTTKASNTTDSITPLSTPPSGSSKSADKTAEARRRLEAMKNGSGPSASPPQVSSMSPSPPATPPSFSIAKAYSHVPGKPSRLSIAFNANESPSSGSTADDEDAVEPSRYRSSGEVSRTDALVSSADDEGGTRFGAGRTGEAPLSISTVGNKFEDAVASKAAGVPFSAPAKSSSEVVGSVPDTASVQPAPFSSAAPSLPASTANSTLTPSATPFVFQPVGISKPLPEAPPVIHRTISNNNGSVTAREQALRAPSTALRQFDLSFRVTERLGGHVVDAQELKRAQAVEITSLPTFDLGSTQFRRSLSSQSTSASANGSQGVEPPLQPSPMGTFNFTSPPVSKQQSATHSGGFSFASASTPAATAPSNDDAETDNAQEANGTAIAATATDNVDGPSSSSCGSSALLGSGQGEENESTLYEVRAKFWKFKDGKWADLGVGLARIKEQQDTLTSTSTAENKKKNKRLLVRNVGNGAVSVNFRLFEGFKVTQNGNTLSFTGFDEHGAGLPMRCKVKTEQGAREFKGELEVGS